MLKFLKERNASLIKKYEGVDKALYNKQKVISQLLMNDNCFFEIPIEISYSILSDLEIEQGDIKKIYLELTKPAAFNG